MKQKEDTQKRRWRQKVKETRDTEKKRERNTEMEIKRKNGEMREKKKGEKSKKRWTKRWREKSEQRKKWWKKMLKEKMWNKKKNWTGTKNEGFWADFSWYLSEERKRINKEFQKEFRNKRICHTHFLKKKTEKEEKTNGRKKKTEDAFSNSLEKTTFFQIHQNRKVINVKLNEQENKKGELRKKRETISQDTEKQDKAWKIIVKHVQQERNQTKSCFLWKEENRKRKLKRRFKTKKKIKNSKKVKETRKHGETRERTRGQRMNKKDGIKRQSRHS